MSGQGRQTGSFGDELTNAAMIGLVGLFGVALVLRDRGCVFPGCTVPPAHCDAHHIIPWWDNGPTSLSNCLLDCFFVVI